MSSFLRRRIFGNFTKKEQATLTRAFERLAVPVLKAHAPGAQVHLFGTSGAGVRGRYRGGLAAKAQRLADDLRIECIVDADKISPRNVGDQGIDAVVWFDTYDASATKIAIFAQCACSYEDWPRKMLDVVEDAFVFWFVFFSPITNLLMIPFCFRDATGDWFDTTRMKRGVLFDRVRILLVLERRAGDRWAAVEKIVPETLLSHRFPRRGLKKAA